MPQYIIHVGPHKTGSTYLQLAFHDLRKFLADRGILYPLRWYIAPNIPNHLSLFTRLQRGDVQLQEDFAQLNSSKYEKVLISAEDLSDLSVEGLTYLKALIQGSDLSIVFYCRRWSDTLPSLWQEWIKQGRSFSLPEYYLLETGCSEKSTTINFAVRLDKIATTLGKDNLRIVSYSNIVDRGGDILAQFLSEFFSLRDFPPIDKKLVNVSLSLIDTEIIRILNTFHQRQGHAVRDLYLANKSSFETDVTKRAMAAHISSVVMDDARLGNLHTRLYERFRDVLINPSGTPQLFEPRRRDVPYVNTDYLMVDGVVSELYAIYDSVKAKL